MMDRLDRVLHQRHEPKTPRGLADRIVQRVSQVVDNSFSIMDLFTPQYSFAMVAVLLIGLNVGFEDSVLQNFMDADSAYSEIDANDMSGVVDVETMI